MTKPRSSESVWLRVSPSLLWSESRASAQHAVVAEVILFVCASEEYTENKAWPNVRPIMTERKRGTWYVMETNMRRYPAVTCVAYKSKVMMLIVSVLVLLLLLLFWPCFEEELARTFRRNFVVNSMDMPRNMVKRHAAKTNAFVFNAQDSKKKATHG